MLYEIDSAPFKAALDSAAANLDVTEKTADRARAALAESRANVTRQKATLDLALTNRQRFEDLLQDKAVSTSDRDQAVSNAQVAQATLLAVEAQVDTHVDLRDAKRKPPTATKPLIHAGKPLLS